MLGIFFMLGLEFTFHAQEGQSMIITCLSGTSLVVVAPRT
jgi:hypothetical protein